MDEANRIGPATPRRQAWILLYAIACVAIYAATFAGRAPIWTRVNAVTFADAAHYVSMLDDGHYRACVIGPARPAHGEHQRKTVHHVLYLLIGEGTIDVISALPAVDARLAMWLISPLLGGLNVLLAADYFRRTVHSGRLAIACTLLFPLLPGTWVYAAIPESWILSTTAVLLLLYARGRGASPALLGACIGVCSLTNFLLLMTVLLVAGHSRRERARAVFVAGLVALATWMAGLTVFGLLLSPAFFPHNFLAATFAFKARFTENLGLLHPGRWIYNAANVLVLPFVLNQDVLDFGRFAIADTVRRIPLGTMAVAALAAGWLAVAAAAWRAVRQRGLGRALGDALFEPELVYLAVAFLATGIVLYYESFLYATMTTPIVLALMAKAVADRRPPAALVWSVVVVGLLNALQQIYVFRTLLGGPAG